MKTKPAPKKSRGSRIKIPTIRLKKCILRALGPGDEQSLALNANNIKVARNLTDAFPHPYALKDAIDWIRFNSSADNKNTHTYAIAVDGKAVGCIGFGRKKEHSCVLGYWIGEGYWGKGIMTEAARAVIREALKDKKIRRVFAHVYVGNEGSKRVLEKAGLALEGVLRKEELRFGEFKDAYVLAKVR